MSDHNSARQAWADYMDNAPIEDIFSDAYHARLNALWMAYIEALGGKYAVQAFSDLVALKTPDIAPETDLDPTPHYTPDAYHYAPLPKGRYRGKVNRTRRYIHCPELHRDFQIMSLEVIGVDAFTGLVEGDDVEFSINSAFSHALRIVLVGHEPSERNYQFLLEQAKRPARIDTTRRPRNLAEARAQAEQRKRDAQQREQARKEAHQTHDTRAMSYAQDGTYDIDDLQAYDSDISF
jgi:hypothetical protein